MAGLGNVGVPASLPQGSIALMFFVREPEGYPFQFGSLGRIPAGAAGGVVVSEGATPLKRVLKTTGKIIGLPILTGSILTAIGAHYKVDLDGIIGVNFVGGCVYSYYSLLSKRLKWKTLLPILFGVAAPVINRPAIGQAREDIIITAFFNSSLLATAYVVGRDAYRNEEYTRKTQKTIKIAGVIIGGIGGLVVGCYSSNKRIILINTVAGAILGRMFAMMGYKEES